jgi:hypothetical protein
MKKIIIALIIGSALASCASTSHCDAYGNVEHKTDTTEVMS